MFCLTISNSSLKKICDVNNCHLYKVGLKRRVDRIGERETKNAKMKSGRKKKRMKRIKRRKNHAIISFC